MVTAIPPESNVSKRIRKTNDLTTQIIPDNVIGLIEQIRTNACPISSNQLTAAGSIRQPRLSGVMFYREASRLARAANLDSKTTALPYLRVCHHEPATRAFKLI